MRTINKFFYLLAAVAFTGLVSCQPEENFKPGKPDNAQCIGVYFPKQDVTSEQQIFSPTDVKHDSIQVSRSDFEDSLVVTLKVGLSYKDAKGVTHEADSNFFKVSEVEFEAGQADSWVYLDFDEAEEGVAYSLHLSIEGEEYSSNYSSNLKACDYSVLCVKYIDFVSPKDTTKPADVTFYHGWWGEEHVVNIKYYEVGGVRHCITYNEHPNATKAEEPNWSFDGGFWGQHPDIHFQFDWYVEDQECDCADEKHECKVPAGVDGVPEGAQLIHNVVAGPVYAYGYWLYPLDYYTYYCLKTGYSRSFIHFIVANNVYNGCSYYDGNGGFYFFVEGYALPDASLGVWTDDYDLYAIADGFNRADYSLKLTAGITQADSQGNNVVPVAFELGADVDKVGYTISKGKLSAAQVAKEASAIAKDTIDYKYANYVDAQGVSFSDSVSVAETGIYTLVAVGFDTLKKAKSNASVNFHYLATGETNPVLLSVSAGSSEKYASRGYSPETSFEVTISGSGITGAIPLVYTQAEIEAEGGIGAVVNDILANPNDFYGILGNEKMAAYYLSASQLADVNDKGYVDIVSDGVTPGTMYYVLVWATNGYDYTVEGATVTTAGDPLPVYQHFDYTSYPDALAIDTCAALIGTWNLYGVDALGGGSLRTYLGKAKVTRSDIPDGDVDTYGYFDQYVTVEGLLGPYSSQFTDSLNFIFYANRFYVDIPDPNVVVAADGTVPYMYSEAQQDYGWFGQAIQCIPVADGYFAIVCGSKNYAAYNFNGIAWCNDKAEKQYDEYGLFAIYKDYLFVDPAKDDNGLAPKTIAKKAFYNPVAAPSNYVEKVSGSGRSFAKASKAGKPKHNCVTLKGVKGLQSTTDVVRVKASHNVSIASPKVTKENCSLTVSNAKTRKVK